MHTANLDRVIIREAELRDAEATRAIYNEEIVNSVSTFDLVPRTPAEQITWLSERSGAHVVLVAESDDQSIAGFASLSPFRERPAYATTVESSVYVDKAHRGSGIAKTLMGELVGTARSHGFHTLIARITEANGASIGLHESIGFDLVGVEREVGRKFNRWLDVVVMQLLLNSRGEINP